ncbi:MAG TPA: histidine phosphatase family protein [Chloroflexota bacterium]|nr:histidine phosphatase family protein [Chloroflexota bacterium]
MRLVLVRHGESDHARRGLIAGVSGCTGLTERGIAQAQQLANRLANTGELNACVALLSSPVLRARQTAEILATVLPAKKIETDCDLCELHPGEADGLSWEEYRSRYGSFALQAYPDRPFAPGGESWSDFVGRVPATLDRLAERFAGQTVVAVSHAGFIVVSLLERLRIPPSGERARLDPVHTSLTEWWVSDKIWCLERYNDTYHLFSV